MGCVRLPLLRQAYNAVMPLSRAPTRGRYSRIVGVTERHQHAVVKNLSRLGQVWVYASHETRVSHKKPHGSVRETCHLRGQNDIRRLFFLSIFFLVSK